MDVFFFNFRGKKKQKMIKGKHRHAHAHTHNPDTPDKDNDSPYLHENIKQCRKAGLTVPLNSSCICHRNTYLSTQDQFCNQAWLWKKLFCMSKYFRKWAFFNTWILWSLCNVNHLMRLFTGYDQLLSCAFTQWCLQDLFVHTKLFAFMLTGLRLCLFIQCLVDFNSFYIPFVGNCHCC